jgi:hypothetical protein
MADAKAPARRGSRRRTAAKDVTRASEATKATVATDGGDTSGPPPGPPGTSGDYAVAGLLFYKELDCLVDLAYLVSLDFFDRPQLYRHVTEDVVSDLTKLRARYGHHEDFLSREQRHEIFAGVFGEGEGAELWNGATVAPPAGSFAGLRDQALAAAAAFGERVYSTSEELLRATMRIQHVYLKDYLQRVTGASVKWSRDHVLPAITERCYRILRNPQIAARFSVDRAPSANWPVEINGDGSTLVEQISTTSIRGSAEPISREIFDEKHQLALQGAQALVEIMGYKGELDRDSTDRLINACYYWYAARGRVLGLPIAVVPPPARAPLAAPAAAAPALALAPMDGNRSLYDAAPNAIPGRIS